MSVKVCFHGYISPLPNLSNDAEVKGKTIGQCLDEFLKLYPNARQSFFDKEGKFSSDFAIFLNGDMATSTEIYQPVEDGDILDIISIFEGG
ncbi:MAG: MoaD/ThiS family protein [Chloroflexota bacterium]